jgi:nitrogen fixation/metabolism regulation signal transduction histidine kinase
MSSSLKYILYITALHLAIAVIAKHLFANDGVYLLLAELLLLGSTYIAYRIYRSIISPLQLLGRGAAALEDQDFSVKLLPTGSVEMDRIGKVYNRMIDQLREERINSRQQDEFLDRLLGAAELGVVILDYDGEVSSMNNWMERKCHDDEGFRAAILDPFLHLRPRSENPSSKPDGQAIAAVSRTDQVITGPGNRRYHVETATFIDRGFERGFVIVQDVTADILSAEKEAYGKVIRMMAHEVNNSNAAIISVLRSLLEAATDGEDGLRKLNQDYLPIVITRAENMTTFMRNFARVVRLPSPDHQRTNLNDLLRRTGDVMATVLANHNINLSYDLPEEGVIVRADAAQLEQVVINALTNSRESIGSGGNIHISAISFPQGFIIADDGPGIPASAAQDIFTPFFSTKPTGQGVGLTLTREILEAHKTSYQLATEKDGWTRLRVTFKH